MIQPCIRLDSVAKQCYLQIGSNSIMMDYHLVNYQNNFMICTEKMLHAFYMLFHSYCKSEVRILPCNELISTLSFRLMRNCISSDIFIPHFMSVLATINKTNLIVNFVEKIGDPMTEEYLSMIQNKILTFNLRNYFKK